MCGRFIIFSEAQEREIESIVEEVNRKYSRQKSGEVFPTDASPIVTYDNGKRDVNLFKWGFPSYKGGVVINARSETLMERVMFREPFMHHRCLVPASAFFEWKQEEGKKKKYIIRPSDAGLFYMAGLYEGFIGKDGLPFTAFVVITTKASSKMSRIHDRMPVILPKEALKLWTDSSTDVSKLSPLFEPSSDLMIEPA